MVNDERKPVKRWVVLKAFLDEGIHYGTGIAYASPRGGTSAAYVLYGSANGGSYKWKKDER